MDYATLYKLCKRISTHVEMAVQCDGVAKEKLKAEIDEDVEKLKILLTSD